MFVRVTEIQLTIDYSGFNQQARSFAAQVESAANAADLRPGTPPAQAASSILRSVLGGDVYGGVLESGARLDYEINFPDRDLGSGRLYAIEQLLAKVDDLDASSSVDTDVRDPAVTRIRRLPGVPVVVRPTPALEQGDLPKVEAIVLHRTSGANLQGALKEGESTREGTHYYVDKDGTVYQTVSLDNHTAHVGKIKSRCIQEPGSCTPKETRDARTPRGIPNLNTYEQNQTYPRRYPTNEDSIGIEVVANYDKATNTFEAPTEAQRQSIMRLVEALKTEYGLDASDIYQHDKISYKTDGEGAGLGY
jgi:hypothetical protein